MKLKSKAQDFRVVELLADGYLAARGRFRVYRVTKKKLTSMEAAGELASRVGIAVGDVGIAGLKDRQGITTQFMSVPRGLPVFVKSPMLRIESVGFAAEPLTSEVSLGNAFEITVRDLSRLEAERTASEVELVREHGVPNYFGEQRFGNLKHHQGWIALDLVYGHTEKALRRLLSAISARDDARTQRFKQELDSAWGDWRTCRDHAGRFGQHHSVFEHLARNEGDFAGAFRFIASRTRLIHLYALQSHLWNRAVARFVEQNTTPADRIVVYTREGPLVFPRSGFTIDPEFKGTFRLPGPGLEDVKQPVQRDLLTRSLREYGLNPSEFRIDGVPGFALKGEDRDLVVRPRRLRVDFDRHVAGKLTATFELPRGAYATLVMARLLRSEREEDEDQAVGASESEGHGRGRGPAREPRRPGGEYGASQSRSSRGDPRSRPDRSNRPTRGRATARDETHAEARGDRSAHDSGSRDAGRSEPRERTRAGSGDSPRSEPARESRGAPREEARGARLSGPAPVTPGGPKPPKRRPNKGKVDTRNKGKRRSAPKRPDPREAKKTEGDGAK